MTSFVVVVVILKKTIAIIVKVIVFVKATPSSEAGEMPSEQLLADMGKYNEQLVAAGFMKAGEGLKPSREGVRIRFSSTNRTVIDGPFAETKELVAGFWIWEVRSMQEAIEWVKRCPNPMIEDSDIEIRPCYGMEDFADADPSGELMKEEQELYAKIENMSADEAEIRHMMHEWSRALEAKDLDQLFKDYPPMLSSMMPFRRTKLAVWITSARSGRTACRTFQTFSSPNIETSRFMSQETQPSCTACITLSLHQQIIPAAKPGCG
jgi:hypothetical protein